jgi:hypothetical protein
VRCDLGAEEIGNLVLVVVQHRYQIAAFGDTPEKLYRFVAVRGDRPQQYSLTPLA